MLNGVALGGSGYLARDGARVSASAAARAAGRARVGRVGWVLWHAASGGPQASGGRRATDGRAEAERGGRARVGVERRPNRARERAAGRARATRKVECLACPAAAAVRYVMERAGHGCGWAGRPGAGREPCGTPGGRARCGRAQQRAPAALGSARGTSGNRARGVIGSPRGHNNNDFFPSRVILTICGETHLFCIYSPNS